MDIGVWDVLAVMVKAALYAATFAAAGGAFFLCYAGGMLDDGERRLIGRRIERCFIAAVVASVLKILVTAGSLTDGGSGMFDPKLLHMVWHSGEDSAVITRIAGLLLAMRAVQPPRPSMALAAVGGACAAMSFAWVGHAHATGAVWTVACVALHLVSVAFWIGALGPLALLARGADPRRAGAAAARFGAAALAVVSVLVLAGLFALWRFLGHASALWTSPYGVVMCVKLVFVAGLLSLAAFNKTRLTPRLLAGDAAAARSLSRSIHAEMTLAALILLTTAALTTLMGPPALG
ncbi:MAG TPA: CopD family protein [Steroidobacteraceae bacterium]|nr:CopD family protein [Steroidobacteraceae bacterium]